VIGPSDDRVIGRIEISVKTQHAASLPGRPKSDAADDAGLFHPIARWPDHPIIDTLSG